MVVQTLAGDPGRAERDLRRLGIALREVRCWIEAPDPDVFLADLRRLGEALALLPPPP